MTSTQHIDVVQRQFGEQASAYLSSAVHAQGSEFALLQAELAGQAHARVLDLGCGAGHVSFHVAPLVAEVVAYDDFIQYKGESGAKEAGKWRLEGKDYIVKDGDVMHFRFNV